MPDGPTPDVYVDQFTVAMTPYGLALNFSLSSSMPNPAGMNAPTPQVVVRMSLEHAKSMTMLLRRSLKQYELEQIGDPIRLPKEVMRQMNLTDADW